MKKLIILLIAVGSLTSCGQGWRFAKYPPTNYIQDSIYIKTTETVYRDTTINHYLPGDTVVMKDTVFMDEKTGLINFGKKRLDTKYAWSQVWIEKGVLHHELYEKPDAIEITIKDAIKEKTVEVLVYKPIRVPAEFSWWQKLWIGMGKIFAGVLISGLMLLTAALFIKKIPFL